ncbi:MAG: hypothetical protein AAF483_11255, partial [Planctomycetota bacterium]
MKSGVSEKAKLACPKCEEEFVLIDLLESQYGFWKVVTDPGDEIKLASEKPDFREVSRPLAGTVSAGSLSGNQPVRPAANIDDDEELKIRDAEDEAKPKQQFTSVEPITYEQFEKMKRKDRSPLWSMIQIVLGGLAAIPIALILIWHLLGKDIGGAGPVVAKYAPWLVPEKFHPEGGDDEEGETGTAAGGNGGGDQSNSPAEEDWENAGESSGEYGDYDGGDPDDPSVYEEYEKYGGSGSRDSGDPNGNPNGVPDGNEGSMTRTLGDPNASASEGSDSRSTQGNTDSGDTGATGRTSNDGGESSGGNAAESTSSSGANDGSPGPDGITALRRGGPRTEPKQPDRGSPEPSKGEVKENPDQGDSNAAGEPPGDSESDRNAALSATAPKQNIYTKIEICIDDLEQWRNGGDTEVDSKQKLGDSIY